jgi:hypothetical protein
MHKIPHWRSKFLALLDWFLHHTLFHGFDTLGSHLREEGSLDYDGGLVRLQLHLNFNTNIHRQHPPNPLVSSRLFSLLYVGLKRQFLDEIIVVQGCTFSAFPSWPSELSSFHDLVLGILGGLFTLNLHVIGAYKSLQIHGSLIRPNMPIYR